MMGLVWLLAVAIILSDGIGIVQHFGRLEFAVRTAKSVSALLSAIDRISVATRRFVQVQLYRDN
jgi:hypothetical protein